MATRTAGATFETTSFAWAHGTFTLTGTWSGGEGLGAVKLQVTIDGRRETMSALGDRVAEDGPKWGARFRCDDPPDEGAPVALLLADLEFALPAPDVREPEGGRFQRSEPVLTPPPAPPAPPSRAPVAAAPPQEAPGAAPLTVETPATADADELRALIAELRQERRAAESALQRLQQERERGGNAPRRPVPTLPKRDEKNEDVDYTPAYWVGAFALLLFFIVLIWIF